MVASYFIIGVIWSCWLEYFSTRYLEGAYGADWKGRERLFHITIWPYSLSVFLYNLIKELKNKN